MKKVNFNFFDYDSTYDVMCQYFNLDDVDVTLFLSENLSKSISLQDFIDRFHINLSNFDPSEVTINAKHVTTQPEDFYSLKKYGLLNLKDSLELDTSFSRFLKNNGLTFKLNEKTMNFNNHEYNIQYIGQKCTTCDLGKDEICDEYSICEYKHNMNLLYLKFYKDNFETEIFINGSSDKMLGYSSVRSNPEILNTLDDIIVEIDPNVSLSTQWRKQENLTTLILSFDTNITSFVFYKEINNHVFDSYLPIELLNCNEPTKEFYNAYLLANSFKVITNNSNLICNQLIHDTKIPFSELFITKII